MGKTKYIMVIATKKNTQYSVMAFSTFLKAKNALDSMIESQRALEGELEVEYFGSLCDNSFGRARTTFYPFFGKVVYGAESKPVFHNYPPFEEMSRVIFEVEEDEM